MNAPDRESAAPGCRSSPFGKIRSSRLRGTYCFLVISRTQHIPEGSMMPSVIAMGTGAAAKIDVTIVMPCLRGKMAARLYRQCQGGAHAHSGGARLNRRNPHRRQRQRGREPIDRKGARHDARRGFATRLWRGAHQRHAVGVGHVSGHGRRRWLLRFSRMRRNDSRPLEWRGSLHGVALQRRDQNQRDALEEPVCRQSSAYRSLEPSIRRRRK